ncbi:MAG: DUF1707 SHOCT-like domain-containing protein [Acidimicrobiales bacterium]
MRASDADRRRTIEELGRHCAAGRLDTDEYARRIEAALAASDLEALDELRVDLPMLRIAAPEPLRFRHDRGDQRVLGGYAMAVTASVAVIILVVGLAGSWAWALALLAGWLLGVAEATFVALARRNR